MIWNLSKCHGKSLKAENQKGKDLIKLLNDPTGSSVENRLGKWSGIESGKLWEALQHPSKKCWWIVQGQQSTYDEKWCKIGYFLDGVLEGFARRVGRG